MSLHSSLVHRYQESTGESLRLSIVCVLALTFTAPTARSFADFVDSRLQNGDAKRLPSPTGAEPGPRAPPSPSSLVLQSGWKQDGDAIPWSKSHLLVEHFKDRASRDATDAEKSSGSTAKRARKRARPEPQDISPQGEPQARIRVGNLPAPTAKYNALNARFQSVVKDYKKLKERIKMQDAVSEAMNKSLAETVARVSHLEEQLQRKAEVAKQVALVQEQKFMAEQRRRIALEATLETERQEQRKLIDSKNAEIAKLQTFLKLAKSRIELDLG